MACPLDRLGDLLLLAGVRAKPLAGINLAIGCHEATEFIDRLVVHPEAVLDT